MAKKVQKGEVISIRIKPSLKYGMELLARSSNRNLTSFVESVFADTLSQSKIEVVKNPLTGKYQGEWYEVLWDQDELVRLVALAATSEDLLTPQESFTWHHISRNGKYWNKTKNKDHYWWSPYNLSSLLIDKVREDWEVLNQIGASPEKQLDDYEPAQSMSDEGYRIYFNEEA